MRLESPEKICEGTDVDPGRIREKVRIKVEKKLISLYPRDYIPDNSNRIEELNRRYWCEIPDQVS